MNGFDQEVKDIALLQAQGLHSGKDAFHEATASGAVAAEGDFPPQHTSTQNALGVIVGGFNTWGDGELPQGWFQQHEVGAELGRFVVGAAAPCVEQLAEVSRYRIDSFLHARVRQPSTAIEVPSAKDSLDDLQAFSTNACTWSTAAHAFLEVALEMSPADLPLEGGPHVVAASSFQPTTASLTSARRKKGKASAALRDPVRFFPGSSRAAHARSNFPCQQTCPFRSPRTASMS